MAFNNLIFAGAFHNQLRKSLPIPAGYIERSNQLGQSDETKLTLQTQRSDAFSEIAPEFYWKFHAHSWGSLGRPVFILFCKMSSIHADSGGPVNSGLTEELS